MGFTHTVHRRGASSDPCAKCYQIRTGAIGDGERGLGISEGLHQSRAVMFGQQARSKIRLIPIKLDFRAARHVKNLGGMNGGIY